MTTVLVVDDNDMHRKFLVTLLQCSNYKKVVMAENESSE